MNIFSNKKEPIVRPDPRELPESVQNTINRLKEETPAEILQSNQSKNKISGMDIEIETLQRIVVNGQVIKEIPMKRETIKGDLVW